MTAPPAAPARLGVTDATIGYGERTIIPDLTFEVRDHSFTVIIGPNACGKSTLLRSMARLLRPASGQVVLDGTDIHTLAPREVATRLGMLPQTSVSPDGIRVADLVARGRFPHRRFLRQPSAEDRRIVREALVDTGVEALSGRLVDELSGGQRQRVWIAMALAQQTELLLLDEPTTYLDIAHQVGVLDLCARLHRDGRTVVAVLHDLNHACRYATHLVAMRDGQIIAQGAPSEIVDAELVERVFDLPCLVIPDPISGTPLVVPR